MNTSSLWLHYSFFRRILIEDDWWYLKGDTITIVPFEVVNLKSSQDIYFYFANSDRFWAILWDILGDFEQQLER